MTANLSRLSGGGPSIVIAGLAMTCHHNQAGCIFSPGTLDDVDGETYLSRGGYRDATGFEFAAKSCQILTRVV
jgi:hypothetical protein